MTLAGLTNEKSVINQIKTTTIPACELRKIRSLVHITSKEHRMNDNTIKHGATMSYY